MSWPDPLIDDDGTAVSSPDAWRRRRAQLIRHFEDSVYGPFPREPQATTVRPAAGPQPVFDGRATLEELRIITSAPDASFHLLLVTPARLEAPAPLFLAANFFGNHRVLADPAIAIADLPEPARPAGQDPTQRGAEATAWDVEQTLAAGYAFATFCMSEVVPDDAALARDPLARFASDRGETGAFSVWAWLFSCCVDVLTVHPRVDADRIVALGHSRLGKTALWATAMDERIAAVIPSQSGVGGAAPSRTAPELAVVQADGRPIAETVDAITSRFPHWFSPAYASFAHRLDDLPVDAHELLALCAPRPVLLSNAVDDLWADPVGQFDSLRRADAVYRLLDAEGLATEHLPQVGGSSDGRLGYSLRAGGHSLAAEDWPGWRAFADRWLG